MSSIVKRPPVPTQLPAMYYCETFLSWSCIQPIVPLPCGHYRLHVIISEVPIVRDFYVKLASPEIPQDVWDNIVDEYSLILDEDHQ